MKPTINRIFAHALLALPLFLFAVCLGGCLGGCKDPDEHEPRMVKALEQQRAAQQGAMQSGNIPGNPAAGK